MTTLAIYGLLTGAFTVGYALHALLGHVPADDPAPAAPVVGAAAVHPLPDVAPRRLVWDSYHRTHVLEDLPS